tara:strand:+ start:19853 stop:20626 length:774 start_codon:yes stop_codon:yes gene_type:complete
MNFLEMYSGSKIESGIWSFDLGKEFNGAFGGTNGGVLAAVAVHVAKQESSLRCPTSVDARFIRGCPPGKVKVEISALNEGRTLSVYSVDIIGPNGKLCTRVGVTVAAADQLASHISENIDKEQPHFDETEAKDWAHPPDFKVPLIDSFKPTSCHQLHSSTTRITIPWDDLDTAQEAACVVSDISVGPPVGRVVKGRAGIPNPDLTLRFSPESQASKHVEARCELVNLQRGQATTRIESWCGDRLLAIGVSTTTCIPQ